MTGLMSRPRSGRPVIRLITRYFLLVVLLASSPSCVAYAASTVPTNSQCVNNPLLLSNDAECETRDTSAVLSADTLSHSVDHSHTDDLVRRVPPGVSSLGNNQFQPGGLKIGETQWWYFPKADVNGNRSVIPPGLPGAGALAAKRSVEDERLDEERGHELSKRSATVYLSLTTCQAPTANASSALQDAAGLPPQLEVYVSTSEALQKPGPGQDGSLQTRNVAHEGYMGVTFQADGDVFIGVSAPNSTGSFTGSYTYQIAASIDAFFHNVVADDPFLFFVDSDTDAALLVTNNLTTASPNSDIYKQWMEVTPPYTMFANNINNSALAGLTKSYCALEANAQIGRTGNNVQAGMTSRGLGNKPKEQFYVTGLNRSSTYYGFLAMNGNGTLWGNGIIGGGGTVWKPMNFTTKADNNCAVLYNLSFCSEVAYAVPANPSLSVSRLSSIYDNYAAAMYQNFTYSLQQIQCNTSAESMYSLAVTCDDCAAAYKEWLCAVAIPRCYDYTSDFRYLQVRNAGQAFLNGTSLPANDPLTTDPATNQSRNALIDTEIKPGPYKEILPCLDICYDLVRKCPSALGFGCPRGKWANSTYGYRDPNGDITCSYLGAAYYLNAGTRVFFNGASQGSLLLTLFIFWSVVLL